MISPFDDIRSSVITVQSISNPTSIYHRRSFTGYAI